jgi:hypothetical protein
MKRLRFLTIASLASLAVLPTAAHAQWYAGLYLGANHTHAASISINQPSADTSIRIHDVTFEGRPLASPQYYGIRIGRMLGERRRFGIEVEFIHLKVIGQASRSFRLTGMLDGALVDSVTRMDTIVQQYAMTHGLNFLVVNAVSRHRLGSSRTSWVNRVGAGATIPHAETTVRHVNREQYEYAGPGVHGSTGLDIGVTSWLSVQADYKVTAARPEISIDAGTGRTTSVSHHVTAGFTFGSTR